MKNLDDFEKRTNVTITLADLNALKLQIAQANERSAKAEKETAAARLVDPSGRLPELLATIEAALPIVQFAVGNLDPTTVRGWPHKELAAFAKGLASLSDREKDAIAEEFTTFAKLAGGLEEFRKERDKNKIIVPASASDYGPKTAEAAFVHAALMKRAGMTEEENEEAVPAAHTHAKP